MSNMFHRAVKVIKDRLNPISQGGTNPFIKTVIFGRTEEKDLYKKSIFPIAHIVPVSAPLGTIAMRTNAVNMFAFEVAILEQRDLSNEPYGKFDGDNLQDNLNITYSILQDLISYLKMVNNDLGINLQEVNDFTPILFKDFSILDGWVCRFVLMVPVDDPSDSNPSGSGGNMFDCSGPTQSGGNGGGGNGGTSSNPNDNGEISCSVPIQYLYGARAFFEASNPSTTYQLSTLDLPTIIEYWEDNCTKALGSGGLFIQKCGSNLSVGDELFSTGGEPIAVDGYYIADKTLANSGTGTYLGQQIHYRPTPNRPVEGYNYPYTLFDNPCVIKVENSIITEVTNLTKTDFCFLF